MISIGYFRHDPARLGGNRDAAATLMIEKPRRINDRYAYVGWPSRLQLDVGVRQNIADVNVRSQRNRDRDSSAKDQ